MNRFKHCVFRSDITARKKPQTTDQTTCQITDNITVQIRHHHNIEGFRAHNQLHTHIIHDFIICLDIRIFLCDFLKDGKEHAIAHFQNICLMYTGNPFSVIRPRICKGIPYDACTCLTCDNFGRMHRICINLFLHTDI